MQSTHPLRTTDTPALAAPVSASDPGTLVPPVPGTIIQARLFAGGTLWDVAADGDARALRLYERHYSAHHYADGRTRRLCLGPGEKMILLTPCGAAGFGWRLFHSDRAEDNDPDGVGLNCAWFRNESHSLSSALILDAERHAAARWGARTAYTYVNVSATRKGRSRHAEPGACFIHAGWERDGETQGGLAVLRKDLSRAGLGPMAGTNSEARGSASGRGTRSLPTCTARKPEGGEGEGLTCPLCRSSRYQESEQFYLCLDCRTWGRMAPTNPDPAGIRVASLPLHSGATRDAMGRPETRAQENTRVRGGGTVSRSLLNTERATHTGTLDPYRTPTYGA